MRKSDDRFDGALDEDVVVVAPGVEGGGSETAMDVVSPDAGAESSPRATAAAYTTPDASEAAARSSVMPESSRTNGRSSAPKRYSRPGDSVPARIRPLESRASETTCAAGGR